MSKNRELFKEAIAEAKAVKEMAIANAKAALEETFTPHLKSVLSAKLEEMEKDTEEESVEETKVEEVETTEENEEVKEETETVAEKESAEDEVNLDELLAELNEDEKSEEEGEEKIEETEEVDEAKKKEKSDEKDEKKSEKAEDTDEDVDLESMNSDDLKGFIEDVIKDMVTAGELEAGNSATIGAEKPEGVGAEEEVNIDELLNSLKEDDEEGKDKMEDEAMYETKMKKKEEELDEAKNAIKALRSELSEINLLNAKLLYTNKIFKAKNLNETQKVKILNAFDKAKTVKETKLVYETLSEGIKEKKKVSVTESMSFASKATGTVTNNKKPIIEHDAVKERFKKLAGIN